MALDEFGYRQELRRALTTRDLWLRHLPFPLLGLSIILFVLYEMDRSAKILGGCWIAIGVVYYAILAVRGRARMPTPDRTVA